jgi:hypothetical protein
MVKIAGHAYAAAALDVMPAKGVREVSGKRRMATNEMAAAAIIKNPGAI